jgi:hypothetical protein
MELRADMGNLSVPMAASIKDNSARIKSTARESTRGLMEFSMMACGAETKSMVKACLNG